MPEIHDPVGGPHPLRASGGGGKAVMSRGSRPATATVNDEAIGGRTVFTRENEVMCHVSGHSLVTCMCL